MPEQARTRNFCIVAHIDHGKSTLADRILEITHAVADRDMRAQYLDRMDLERERGITIKAAAVRLSYDSKDGQNYELNLIDTPGHVDFSYEVSRALNACEGAVLLVDASQGIEAQTLANLHLAIEADLEVIPVVNKIDLPSAQPEKVAQELQQVIGCELEDILFVSGKTGEGVQELLEAIVRRVPPPTGDPVAQPRGLIFDSTYDQYRGVIAYVRVVDGNLFKGQRIRMMATGAVHDLEEVGALAPDPDPAAVAGRRRGRVLHRRDQEHPRREGRRHDHRRAATGDRAARRLPRAQADGVRGPVPRRRRRLPGPSRRARAARAQRRGARVRARDLEGARFRVPLRVPGLAAHGDHARAARAGVRPRAGHHRAERGLPRGRSRATRS